MLYTKLMKSLQKPVMTFAVAGLAFASFSPLSVSASVIETAGPAIVSPSGQWVMLESGASRWYSFNYDLDQHANEPSEVTIELESHVVGALSFDVKTSAMTSIGAGATKSKFTSIAGDDSKLIWVGRTEETTHFYVVVKNETPFPSYYALTIDGPDVSYSVSVTDADPTAGSAVEQVATQSTGSTTNDSVGSNATDSNVIAMAPVGRSAFKSADSSTESNEAAEPAGGMTAATALSPDGEWVMLGAGEARWYSFKYDYDQHADNPSEVTIHLDTEVIGALGFEIMTSGMDIFGEGTPKNLITGIPGDDSRLIWVGRTSVSGTYYVLVKNNSDAPALYQLDISGADVSF